MATGSGTLLPTPTRVTGGGNPPPPAREDGGGGGGGSGWVTLVRASNDIEAHLLVGLLGEAGVEGRIVRDKGAPSAWLYGASKPWAPVTVMVRGRQLEDARLVLAEVAMAAPPHVPPVPQERDWRIPVVWWAAALTLGTLFTGVALARTATSMRSCAVPILCND
ncbi:MAG TPA: DUF2007 domain-containing protein [Actinomycetota bacterium]|nr:DUF2007 domain-containing protein [Actinomycetota bacterium]